LLFDHKTGVNVLMVNSLSLLKSLRIYNTLCNGLEPQKIDEQDTLVTAQDRVVTSLTKRDPKDIAQASAPESATNKAEYSAAPAYFCNYLI
jgi:hypothetical protein